MASLSSTPSAESSALTLVASSGGIGRGVVLAGRYVVERVLGEGGMGVVVSVRDVTLERRCALKFLKPEAMRYPDAVERFVREVRCAAQLTSEHVARVLDAGQLDGGVPFLVMDLLDGEDVARRLARDGAVPMLEAIGVVLQAIDAVGEAHAKGIIHRDLKPSNLFLVRRVDGAQLVKVLDFGLSKELTDAASRKALTATKETMGSPLYMAPEVIRSARSATFASDVWALGVVLYELLTADTPFDGESATAVIASITADAPVPLRSRRSDLPAELESVVMRCLSKDPARRPTLAHLAASLRGLASERVPTSIATHAPGALAVRSAFLSTPEVTVPLHTAIALRPSLDGLRASTQRRTRSFMLVVVATAVAVATVIVLTTLGMTYIVGAAVERRYDAADDRLARGAGRRARAPRPATFTRDVGGRVARGSASSSRDDALGQFDGAAAASAYLRNDRSPSARSRSGRRAPPP